MAYVCINYDFDYSSAYNATGFLDDFENRAFPSNAVFRPYLAFHLGANC